MMLSEHFSLAEFTRSDYATRHSINNQPVDSDVVENLHVLAQSMERVRAVLGKPIIVTSAYRSPKVNSGVGGSAKSAHLRGLACDFLVPGMTPREVCQTLVNHDEIMWDQLIYEGDWTHISFAEVDESPRLMILTALFKHGKASYVQGVA